MEGGHMIGYHELRKISPEKAREVIRKVLEREGGNVSRTARILGISRHTVRRAREGPLEDRSRRPKRVWRRRGTYLEGLIVKEAEDSGCGYRMVTSLIWRKYGIRLSENTVKAVLRRKGHRPKRRRTGNGSSRRLYDYEALIPFEEFQMDTKHILDKKSLPPYVYRHIKRHDLPLYEWNLMEVSTRARFTCYSYELNSTFGFLFIVFSVLWLRAHNVRGKIRIRLDNGVEWCGGSERKLKEWNERLRPLGVELDPIPPGAKHLLALVENSHRKDDEYFLLIHAERCNNATDFLKRAQMWQDTWNFFRPHHGIAMDGMTPFEKLKSTRTLINKHILLFPTILLEELMGSLNTLISLTPTPKRGGKYVYTQCLFHAPNV
jgi:transposase